MILFYFILFIIMIFYEQIKVKTNRWPTKIKIG